MQFRNSDVLEKSFWTPIAAQTIIAKKKNIYIMSILEIKAASAKLVLDVPGFAKSKNNINIMGARLY